jgi:hypothetical protein
MRYRILSLLFLLASCAVVARADGKAYWGERVPPEVPFQRALLLFKNGEETLTIQSRVHAAEAKSTNTVLGWVVPVPSAPTLTTMEDDTGWQLFQRLAWTCQPRFVRVREILMAALFIGGLGFMAVGLLLLVASHPESRLWRHRPAFEKMVFFGLVTAGLTFFSPAFLTGSAKNSGDGVDVLDARDVGIYATHTIKSDSSQSLAEWLTAAGFRFEAADRTMFDHYLSNGWCFVVATVRPDARAKAEAAAVDGLIDPLVLRFKAPAPVYPLALTGTIGKPTEVWLYVLSDQRWQTDRMSLRFAGETAPLSTFHNPGYGKLPFTGWELEAKYLCLFRATLSPEAMSRDLVLTPAPDNKPFRERFVKW